MEGQGAASKGLDSGTGATSRFCLTTYDTSLNCIAPGDSANHNYFACCFTFHHTICGPPSPPVEYSEDSFEPDDGAADETRARPHRGTVPSTSSSDGLSAASAELERRRLQLAADLEGKKREILRRSKRQSVSAACGLTTSKGLVNQELRSSGWGMDDRLSIGVRIHLQICHDIEMLPYLPLGPVQGERDSCPPARA